MKITNAFLLIVIILISCQTENDRQIEKQSLELREGFQDPPVSARPKGFWCWVNGNFDLDRITVELEESKANGMGGYDIWDVANLADYENKVPAGPSFMGEESTNAIVHAIKEATRLDLEIGLVVASSWNSGGSWIPAEHGVMGILDTTIIVNDQADLPEKFPFPKLPDYDPYKLKTLIDRDQEGLPKYYKEVAVLARPEQQVIDTSKIINLTDQFKDGKLDWQVPEGEWKVTRYVCTNLGTPLKRPSPKSNGLMIDHFSREAQEYHLQYFIDKLEPELGDLGETALKYLYNDSYEIKGPVWTPQLIREFKERRGYDMTPFLPVLEGMVVQNQEVTDRFLYDYRMTLSDMSIDNHYRFGKEFCNRYGIGYQAEGGGPGPPLHDVPVESIKALGALSVPRGEFWHKYPKFDAEGYDSHWFIKGIASAAHLYDQTFVEAESFTSLLHWQEGWQDLKPTADQAFCEGLNRVVFHTSTHSPDEFGSPGFVYAFGSHMNTRQTWWPKSRAWIDYLARNSYMLQQGNFAGDILYYYGDQAPNFAKQRHIDSTLGFGYDYDVLNTEKLLELEIKNGKMTLPHGQEYALLVLPDQETMPLKVLQKIEEMLNDGALITGPKPRRTPGLYNYQEQDKELKVIADRLWKGLDGNTSEFNEVGEGKLYWGALQRNILFENDIYPDFNFKGQDDSTSLNFIHRKTETADIYFVRNRRNEEVTAECVFRIQDKTPQLWIPETGEIVEDLIYRHEGDSIRLALNFAPYDAYFVLFTDDEQNEHVEEVIRNGQLIFPSTTKFARMYGYNPKTGLFAHEGDYKLNFNNGDVKELTVNSPENFTVNGKWKLTFPEGWKAPDVIELPKLISWTDSETDGVKYFSGIATYEIEFNFSTIDSDHKYILDLRDVRELADVWLNGDSLGVVWHKPFKIDISDVLKKGKNHLVIDVANEWNNRLVGDGNLPEEARVTNTNIVNGPKAWSEPWAQVPLKPAGLLGPVVITSYTKRKK